MRVAPHPEFDHFETGFDRSSVVATEFTSEKSHSFLNHLICNGWIHTDGVERYDSHLITLDLDGFEGGLEIRCLDNGVPRIVDFVGVKYFSDSHVAQFRIRGCEVCGWNNKACWKFTVNLRWIFMIFDLKLGSRDCF